jgi:hypothetical protein
MIVPINIRPLFTTTIFDYPSCQSSRGTGQNPYKTIAETQEKHQKSRNMRILRITILTINPVRG